MTFPPDRSLNGTEPELNELGSFIRKRREALGLTQEMLAADANLSHRSISAIELGRSQSPQLRTIDRLARGLRLTPQQRQTLRTLVPIRSHPARTSRRMPSAPTVEPEAIDPRLIPEGSGPPWPDGPLFGRDTIIAQTVQVLASPVRLLMLTGPPGVGKTRVAIEIGRHPDVTDLVEAVAFVPLAPARTIAEAVGEINAVLGITVSAPPTPIATLIAFLHRVRLLLILDNVEQIPGVESLLTQLVNDAPLVRLVVTSRHISRLQSGRQVVLRPLDLPTNVPISDASAFPEIASVAFLLERLDRSGVRIRLTEGVMADLARICRAMDGLPLALEIAAARLRAMSPADLLGQLRSRRSAPRPGPGGTHHRHRSLHTAIGWSVDLLTPDARAALARISVFSGGFTSLAAKAVISSVAPARNQVSAPVAELLAELVDQHLLVFDHAAPADDRDEAPEGRFRLLETIRDVASTLLDLRDETAEARCAHANWCLDLVRVAERELLGHEPGTWLRRLDRETGNIRDAIDWANTLAARGDLHAAELGLDLSARLWQYWRIRGLSDEGQRRIQRSMDVAEPVIGLGPHPSRARALNNLGILVMDTGDTDRTRALFEASLAMSRAIGNGRDIADTVNNLGVLAVYHGNYVDAEARHREAYELRLRIGDRQRLIFSLQNLGDIGLDTDVPELAREFHLQGIRIAEEVGDRASAAFGYLALGEVESDQGHAGPARRYFTRALDIFVDIDDQLGLGFLAHAWGYLAQQQGDSRAALEWQKRALGHWQRSNNRRGQVAAIEATALILVALGRLQLAADLLASARRIRADERMGRPPKRTPAIERASAALAEAGHQRGEAVATTMSLDRVVAHTLRLDPVMRQHHHPRRIRPGRRLAPELRG